MEEQVLDFFKTFSDANRLRIAALLLDEACTVEEIAGRLKIKISDLPRQLAQIEKMGLLRQEGDRYRLDTKALEALSRQVLAGARPQVNVRSNDENADDFDQKTLKSYSLPDGRLREIPLQEKKLQAILRHVVQVFEPGVRYNEKQVNEMMKRFHPDSAMLRRSLVDFKMIEREQNGSSYWRPEKN
jgi:hypothetical protein